MGAARKIFLMLRNTVMVTLAVVLGFAAGDALGLPVWLQGIFLLPAVLLFFALSGERRPSGWSLLGLLAATSILALVYQVGSPHLPEPYLWVLLSLMVVLLPSGSKAGWWKWRSDREKLS